MTTVAVRTEGLGKRYRIGQPRPGLRRSHGRSQDLWALRDVSFEVAEGEVLGIVGPNGAGKSTLLKILSRITEPTEGWAAIAGQVRSLLEVGTGFHPELTGRENVYLNGAILGMRRSELKEKLAEIVSFAELERFVDTPVKRYSSGMYVRLAFAVAAHLDPEILIVDEVLAVGDAAFQRKCLGKMGEAGREGRTVLFVSHNMNAIRTLCDRAMLLSKGSIAAEGSPTSVVNTYLGSGRLSKAESVWSDARDAPGNELFRLRSVRVRSADGMVTPELGIEDPFQLEIEYRNLVEGAKLGTTVVVLNEDGICVFSSLSNTDDEWHNRPRPRGLYRTICEVPAHLLPPGRFTVSVILWGENYGRAHREDDVVELQVDDSYAARGDYLGDWAGVVRPRLHWTTHHVPESAPLAASTADGAA